MNMKISCQLSHYMLLVSKALVLQEKHDGYEKFK